MMRSSENGCARVLARQQVLQRHQKVKAEARISALEKDILPLMKDQE